MPLYNWNTGGGGAVTLPITGNGVTVTTSQPLLDLTQTWNASGTTFTGLKLNVTDTASASGSLLMQLQQNGVDRFQSRKNGDLWFSGSGLFAGSSDVGNMNIGNSLFLQYASRMSIAGSTNFGWTSSASSPSATLDLFLTRRAAANLRLGSADAAAPIAQTLSVQSVVAGTTNTAGANLTITGSQGTGTGAGGSIIFQVAPAGASGTAVNALETALTIASNSDVTIPGTIKSSNYYLLTQGSLHISMAMATRTDGALGSNGSFVAIAANGSLGWSNTDFNPITSVDLRLFRDAANTLALRNGTNAQTARIYGSFTSASVYKRLALSSTTTVATVAAETDAGDMDLALTPAGAGNVRYGTHSAIGAETITGFIEIKDAGGTVRKLAVVS
jgi:hypothetical protein